MGGGPGRSRMTLTCQHEALAREAMLLLDPIVSCLGVGNCVPEVAEVFDWTGRLCGSRGWRYEVWSGADATSASAARLAGAA